MTGWVLPLVHDEHKVGTYTIWLSVRADQPLTRSQLDQLDAGRHDISASGKPRGRTLEVSLTMAGGDVAGALARSLNTVLDVVPGSVREASVAEIRPRHRPTRRRHR